MEESDVPTPDQIELFFWEVFAVSAPALHRTHSTTGEGFEYDSRDETGVYDGGKKIHYYEVGDHTWLHDTSRRIRGRWIISPIEFKQIGKMAHTTLSGHFFQVTGEEPQHSALDEPLPKTPFTIETHPETGGDLSGPSDTTWATFRDRSLEYPLLLKVTGRTSPIDIWCYQNLFMIIEHDKWMFMTLDAFSLFIKKGMMDGDYIGMYVLPNSAFVNFSIIKLSRTPLQKVNHNLMREKLDKKYA